MYCITPRSDVLSNANEEALKNGDTQKPRFDVLFNFQESFYSFKLQLKKTLPKLLGRDT